MHLAMPMGLCCCRLSKPIAFHSYKGCQLEMHYPAREKEMFMINSASRRSRCYLDGATLKVLLVV